jgi:glycosyltransferase involved in cell wall biosynthesis
LNASVVVATRNRREELACCLDALRRQHTARAYEVIVVDDGTTPPLEPVEVAPATLIRGRGVGPAAARNAGIEMARGGVVLFTDDDALPDANWIESACSFLEQHPDDVAVGGRTVSPPFDYLYERSVECDGVAFWTCNVAYRRDALRKLGGFYEGFRAAHCEDLDLGYRALELGSIGFDAAMLVVHLPRPVPLRQFVGWGRLAKAEVLLYSRHPDRYPVPRWLPRRGLAFAGTLVHWTRALRSEGLALVASPRRLCRFLVVSAGQTAGAATSVIGRRNPA